VSKDPHGATEIHASKGGGGPAKWLLGGLAAVVLLGGGYYAWQNYVPSQPSSEIALTDPYADSYSDAPMRAGPVDSEQDTLAQGASTDEATVSTPATTTRRAASTPSTTSRVQTAEVPEETFGITPASATTGYTQEDDIVVTAPRRPIWARTPSARRLSELYPARALERGREGEARLHCTVLSNGALDCARVEETPGGFGNAALRVARTLRHAPQLRDGSDATGSPVNLRVVFRMADEDRRGRG
jgi:TonB family protein